MANKRLSDEEIRGIRDGELYEYPDLVALCEEVLEWRERRMVTKRVIELGPAREVPDEEGLWFNGKLVSRVVKGNERYPLWSQEFGPVKLMVHGPWSKLMLEEKK